MTKEKLLAKIAELEQRKAQLLANGNAINGAIEECKYWLAELEKPEKEPEPS